MLGWAGKKYSHMIHVRTVTPIQQRTTTKNRDHRIAAGFVVFFVLQLKSGEINTVKKMMMLLLHNTRVCFSSAQLF